MPNSQQFHPSTLKKKNSPAGSRALETEASVTGDRQTAQCRTPVTEASGYNMRPRPGPLPPPPPQATRLSPQGRQPVGAPPGDLRGWAGPLSPPRSPPCEGSASAPPSPLTPAGNPPGPRQNPVKGGQKEGREGAGLGGAEDGGAPPGGAGAGGPGEGGRRGGRARRAEGGQGAGGAGARGGAPRRRGGLRGRRARHAGARAFPPPAQNPRDVGSPCLQPGLGPSVPPAPAGGGPGGAGAAGAGAAGAAGAAMAALAEHRLPPSGLGPLPPPGGYKNI